MKPSHPASFIPVLIDSNMPSSIDLHTHSRASDGAFSPAALIQKAWDAGIKTLALTDHDTVAGLDEAQTAAGKIGMTLINGIELSARWGNKPIHIVGLNVNAQNTVLIDAVQHLRQLREERALRISDKLAKVGVANAYDNAKRFAANGTVTRQHFARYLIETGNAKDQTDVFKRFLVRNKPGYVSVDWPNLEATLACIKDAGGVSVIAHPLRYKVTATKLRQLMADFKALGGEAIEVVTGSSNPEEIKLATTYAERHDLAASIGSDFHNEETSWCQLGKMVPLPKTLTPVWELW